MSEGKADHLEPGLKLPLFALSSTGGSDVCLARLPGRSVIVAIFGLSRQTCLFSF